MKKIIPFLIIGILVLSGLGATAATNDEQPETSSVIIRLSKPIIVEEEQYSVISLADNENYMIQTAKPLVPKHVETFTFPIGTKINSVTCELKDIDYITLDKRIIPSPEPVLANTVTGTEINSNYEITERYPEKDFEYDIKVGLYEGEISLILNVEVYPVKYLGFDNKIEWAEDVEININYVNEPVDTTYNDDYNFVIITADEFSSSLQALSTHKIVNGITTKIVTLSEVYSGTYFPVEGRDDAEKVKYFIKDAVENWNTVNVMLVGNKDKFPTRLTHIKVSNNDKEQFVSDLYFADIYIYNEDTQQIEFVSWDSNDNDIFAEYDWNNEYDEMDLSPDVRVSRIPANNNDEVNAVINKVKNYENNVAYTQDWFTDMVVAGGDSFPGDDDELLEGEVVNQEVIEVMEGYIAEKIWVSLGKLTTKFNLNSALNNGAGFVDISGHGNTYVWATHPHKNDNLWLPGPTGGYLSSDIKNLNNGDKLPIVITGACSVSKFSKDTNCFSWAWIANEDGGGITSFGATGLGYAYLGSYVTYGLVEGMAIGTFETYVDGAITVGEMWEKALNGYMSKHNLEDGAEYKTVLEWQNFGDPTTKVAAESIPPETPGAPNGPTKNSAKKEHTYTAITTDPEGDEIYYLFDWGDGSYSGWVGPYESDETASASHKWNEQGNYQIRVKAKDEHGKMSDWSPALPISMAKGKVLDSPLISLIEQFFPNMFEIFQKIIGL